MKDIANSPTLPLRCIRIRSVVPAVLIGFVLTFLAWGAIRGTWTDSESRDPATPAEGVISQLLKTTEGRKKLRAAVIVSAPPERVWQVVTDYDHFSEVFPNISTAKGVRDADGLWHVTGEVRSIAGSWPMDLHVRHEESAARFAAFWDEPNGAWKINRGSWVVTAHGAGETLLEYNLETKVSPFPNFVVRAALLEQLNPMMRAVKNRAERDQTPR